VIAKIKSILANRKKVRILKYFAANPGVSLKEIEGGLRISRSTLRHHIDLLEKEG
jgi:predicted transcriptional regulator